MSDNIGHAQDFRLGVWHSTNSIVTKSQVNQKAKIRFSFLSFYSNQIHRNKTRRQNSKHERELIKIKYIEENKTTKL